MKAHLTLLTIDSVIQLILLVLLGGTGLVALLTSGETLIIFGFLLLVTGAWQLLSGIIFGIIRNDGDRGKYVFGSMAYLIAIGVGGNLLSQVIAASLFLNITAIIFIAILPCLIAGWYFRLTQNDVNRLRDELQGLVRVDDTMNDILDSEEIFKLRI